MEFSQTEHRLYLTEIYGLDCFHELMASHNPSCKKLLNLVCCQVFLLLPNLLLCVCLPILSPKIKLFFSVDVTLYKIIFHYFAIMAVIHIFMTADYKILVGSLEGLMMSSTEN